MKILIVGASGLVGGSFLKNLKANRHEVLGTYNNFPLPASLKLDITDKTEVEKIITNYQPQVVIQPAAYADVDGCEENPLLSEKINILGVKNVIENCIKNQSFYIYFSTDYVFDGRNGPYSENDPTNPINTYGQHKLFIEEYLKLSGYDRFLIVRSCNIYGWEKQGKNFVIRLINNLKQGNKVKIIDDQYGNPTYVENLTRAVLYLLEKGHKGLFHICGTETINRFEFAKAVAQVFNLNTSLISPIKTAQISQKAKRPMRAGLKTSKVQSILPFRLLNTKEGLLEMRKDQRIFKV